MYGSRGRAISSPTRNRASRRTLERKDVAPLNKQEVCARIEEVGIMPAVRARSAEDARFAAETVNRGGIPVVEITVTVPEAVQVISDLTRTLPEMIVGARTVLDVEMASRCLDAGAQCLTSPGLV